MFWHRLVPHDFPMIDNMVVHVMPYVVLLREGADTAHDMELALGSRKSYIHPLPLRSESQNCLCI